MTRSGARALGIAQFMPATAAERHLLEPFNPVEALPKSGKFLADLRAEFGNLGLAAAAYNAGPQRVRKFITGSRGLPRETRNYVLSITGRSVDAWAKNGRLGIERWKKRRAIRRWRFLELPGSRGTPKGGLQIGRSTIAAARGSKLV